MVRFMHANVTSWGLKPSGFDWASHSEVVGVCEHHLLQEKAIRLGSTLARGGWTAAVRPAEPSARSESGSHAGVLTMASSHLSPVCVGPHVGEDVATSSRWSALVIRLKGVSLLFVEAYLHTNQGMQGESVQVLREVSVAIKMHGLPVVMAADWQAELAQVSASSWAARHGLVVVEPHGGFSCTSATGSRLIDFFVVSQTIVGMVRSSDVLHAVPWGPHSAVVLSLDARPRQVHTRMIQAPRPLPDVAALPHDPGHGW